MRAKKLLKELNKLDNSSVNSLGAIPNNPLNTPLRWTKRKRKKKK